MGIAPHGVLGYEDDRDRTKIVVKNEAAILDFADDIHDATRSISATGRSLLFCAASATDFVFDVESLGSIPVDDVVLCGLNTIKRKLGNLQVAVKEIQGGDAGKAEDG